MPGTLEEFVGGEVDPGQPTIKHVSAAIQALPPRAAPRARSGAGEPCRARSAGLWHARGRRQAPRGGRVE